MEHLLDGANIPAMAHQSLAIMRAAIKDAMEKTGKNMKTEGGIGILADADREAARDLIDQHASYGIFVVRGGELERWLKPLGATGHGPPWLIEIFEKMGEDPLAPNYMKPGDDDVWAFVHEIRSWLSNPNRKGIPA